MKAVKENRQYTITDADVKSFVNDGYDIYDDNGKLIHYGIGKTVPFEKYAKLMAQVEAKNDEIVALRDEIESLKAEIAKAKTKARKTATKEKE